LDESIGLSEIGATCDPMRRVPGTVQAWRPAADSLPVPTRVHEASKKRDSAHARNLRTAEGY
jgi:hypothetical protein